MSKSNFWNFIVIIFFALAIVAIGADELHRRFSPGAKRKSGSFSLTKELLGNQSALPPVSSSGKAKQKASAEKAPLFFDTFRKDRSDKLERSDKQELQDLVDSVSGR